MNVPELDGGSDSRSGIRCRCGTDVDRIVPIRDVTKTRRATPVPWRVEDEQLLASRVLSSACTIGCVEVSRREVGPTCTSRVTIPYRPRGVRRIHGCCGDVERDTVESLAACHDVAIVIGRRLKREVVGYRVLRGGGVVAILCSATGIVPLASNPEPIGHAPTDTNTRSAAAPIVEGRIEYRNTL